MTSGEENTSESIDITKIQTRQVQGSFPERKPPVRVQAYQGAMLVPVNSFHPPAGT
jgi:hypothetical protein